MIYPRMKLVLVLHSVTLALFIVYFLFAVFVFVVICLKFHFISTDGQSMIVTLILRNPSNCVDSHLLLLFFPW